MPSHQTFPSIGIHTRGLVNVLVSTREYEFSELHQQTFIVQMGQ